MGDTKERSPKSKPYLETKIKAVHPRNEGIPKGLMGYRGKTPVFSTREIASLWMLQIMASNPEGPTGDGWYGRALVREVRSRTQVVLDPTTGEQYEGYKLSDGVVFGLLEEWAKQGLITVVREELAAYGRTQRFYKITDAGREFLEHLKEEMRPFVLGAALLLNRLYSDLYMEDVFGRPVDVTQLDYGKSLDDDLPMPTGNENAPG